MSQKLGVSVLSSSLLPALPPLPFLLPFVTLSPFFFLPLPSLSLYFHSSPSPFLLGGSAPCSQLGSLGALVHSELKIDL